jgi:hypothetical protein
VVYPSKRIFRTLTLTQFQTRATFEGVQSLSPSERVGVFSANRLR